MKLLALFAILFVLFPFSIQCPAGWNQSAIQHNKCYFVATQKEIWFDAELFCQNAYDGAHLTSICSAFENANVDAIAIHELTTSLVGSIWIGLNDINTPGVFEWTDGNTYPFASWSTGQPNTSSSTQCVSSLASTGKWATQNCAQENFFVCAYVEGSVNPTTTTTRSSSPTLPTTSFPITTTSTTGQLSEATDCFDLYTTFNIKRSGVYSIYPPGSSQLRVYCDMETDGGGWTVFQRRLNGSLPFFNKTWTEYKNGFNDGLANTLWLGNDNIRALSIKDTNVELRIDLWEDRANTATNPFGYWFEKYTSFYLETEENYYMLHISSVTTGNASDPQVDGMSSSFGRHFSTIDRDNTQNHLCASATLHLGGWWFSDVPFCSNSALNGQYIPESWHSYEGLFWQINTGIINPARTRMMLRKLVS